MISVVIPSYNRRDSMLSLLETVVAQADVEFEIIVVDDCSTDDSVEQIASLFPEVRLFVNEKNSGPAVSRNRGIREALGEIVVGFDSDVTVPDQYCLKKVQEAFSQVSDAAGLAFRLLQPDGVSDDAARWWHPLPIEKFASQCFETHYFSGTGYAFQKSEVTKAGMYPEILYMHYEEVELAYRILDSGKSIVYCPNITVIHHEHQVSRRSEIQAFYKHRNQILLAIACYPFLKGIVWIAPRIAATFTRSICSGNLSNFIKALKSAKELAPIRLKERRPLRKETWDRIKTMKTNRGFSINS